MRPWGSLLLPGQAASGGLGDARPGAGGPRCTLRGPGVPRPPPRLQPRRRAWRVPRSGRLWDPHGSGGMTGLGAAPGGQAGDRVSRAGVSVPHQPLLRVLGLRPERRPVAIPGTAGPGGGGRVCTCGACGWQVWRARGGGQGAGRPGWQGCGAGRAAPITPSPSADGAPLSELSWSSSLAVVAVSFSGLFTVIALMLACLCCKKGGIGFKVRAGGSEAGGRDPKGRALLCPRSMGFPPSWGHLQATQTWDPTASLGPPTGGACRLLGTPAHYLPHFGCPVWARPRAVGSRLGARPQRRAQVGRPGTVRRGLAGGRGGPEHRGRGLASPGAPGFPGRKCPRPLKP